MADRLQFVRHNEQRLSKDKPCRRKNHFFWQVEISSPAASNCPSKTLGGKDDADDFRVRIRVRLLIQDMKKRDKTG
jgi:hypothetical protein